MNKRIFPLMLILTLLLSSTLSFAATSVYSCNEGLAMSNQDGLWGYVNVNGTVVIDYQYDSCQNFTLGMAQIWQDGKVGVIRPDGTYLLTPEYQSLTFLGSGFYLAQQDGVYGIVNVVSFQKDEVTTQIAYPFQYSDALFQVQGGVDVLTLYQGTTKTVIPLFQLSSIATSLGIDGSEFSLTKDVIATFGDVANTSWYSGYVNIVYNIDIMEGTGSNLFSPKSTVTMAQLLTLAANLESIYTGDDFHTTTTTSGSWYQPALDYCITAGIISANEVGDVSAAVTRTQVAQVLGATSLAGDLEPINNLQRVQASIPDVTTTTPGADAIYALYAAGILNGVDSNLTFSPDDTISRAEIAAMVARIARPEQRLSLW